MSSHAKPSKRTDAAATASTARPDHSPMKLGKLEPRHDPRTLQLANYIHAALPPAPPRCDNGAKVREWPMMVNDRIGDCTCAAAGHLIQEWTTDAGKPFVPSDTDIVAAYSAITGYDPKTGKNDNGAVELDVLKYWQKTGIAGHTIGAYVALEPAHVQHVRESIYLFGGCYIGLALPLSAQTQRVWSVPPGGPIGQGAPRSWGGHAVPIVAYDERGLTCITWGQRKRMTWTFWSTYCDEAYAILGPDFFDGKKKSPNGFDMGVLAADLKEVKG